jgi:predicted transcriptional regulator
MASPTFADFVRKRTIELHLTQGELAQRAGLSRQAVVKLLSGDTLDPQISCDC